MFHELLEYCKALAIKNALLPNDDTMWRSICRAYSKTFFVPLPQVMAMDPEHVIMTVLEDRYESIDVIENVEKLLDQVYAIEDPEYRKQQAEELDAFAELSEEREQKRLNKKTVVETKEEPQENKPTGGSVDFSNLKNEG